MQDGKKLLADDQLVPIIISRFEFRPPVRLHCDSNNTVALSHRIADFFVTK